MNQTTSPPLAAPPLGLRLLLTVCALAVVAQLYVPLPILGPLAQALDMTPAAAAAVVSTFGLAYAAGFLVFGPLSDRLGRRRVMFWGLCALATISAVLGWMPSAPLLLAARALQGFAAAAFPPVVIAYLAERGTPQQRTWGVAGLSTAFLCAALLGQIYGAALAARWGLGIAMLPLALVYAVTAAALRMAADDTPLAASTSAGSSAVRALPALLMNVPLRRVYVPAFLLLLCFVAFYLALDRHAGALLAAHGISPLLARAVALPGFLAPLAVAALMPRLGARRVVLVGLLAASSGLLLCAWGAAAAQVFGLLAASVVFVAGIGISVPGLIARVAALAPAPQRGLAVAFYTFVLFMGASLGPWLERASALAHGTLVRAALLLAALLGAALLYVAAPSLFSRGDCR